MEIDTQVATKADDSNDDPYRTTIHFLAGLLTFCLGVIAAVFSALNRGDADPQRLGYRMLGGVLGSIAVVAWVCTVAVACIQTMKFMHRYKYNSVWNWPVLWRAGAMLLLALLGGMTVAYCIRYGYAILAGLDAPVGLWNSLTSLFLLAL